MEAVREFLRLGAELSILRFLVGDEAVRVRSAQGGWESATYYAEARAALEALTEVGIFTTSEADRWRSQIAEAESFESAAGAPHTEPVAGQSYLEDLFSRLGQRVGREDVERFGSALDVLWAVNAIDDEDYADWLGELEDRVPGQLRPEGRYFNVGRKAYASIVATAAETDEYGEEPVDLLPAELREHVGRPHFTGRDLFHVVPGPVKGTSGLTVIAAELCGDGVLLHWHRVRPPGEEPPDPGEGPPNHEFFVQMLEFGGEGLIDGLKDDVGTEYERASGGGGGGWDASRPNFQVGSTAFVPAVPEAATRLEVKVGPETVLLSLDRSTH